jgi:glycine/D-amino acid oxidase-like deaminating enzyme
MSDSTYDVIIVGGGVMGWATAYYLLKFDEQLNVVVVEMDPTLEKSSTLLSDGNARIQFNVKENIEISLYGLEVLERFADEMSVGDKIPDISFRRQGNLFLIDESGYDEAQFGLEQQRSLGCSVEWLSPTEIAKRYPLLNPEGIVGATFSSTDGTMDPWAVVNGYKNKALELGVKFVHGEVSDILTDEHSTTGVSLISGRSLAAGHVVNCAGAWASRIARTVGITLPVQPVKRQVFVLETTITPENMLPLIAFPSGLYLIHESQSHFLCGKSLEDDPVGFEFDWEQRQFEEILWPELVEYVPSFDRLKVVRGWAGLYAVNTFDGNAILGEWPDLEGFFLANGFSGHGFQQCHAVGRYLAELILDRSITLDLSIFDPDRILNNAPVFENRQRIV